MIEIVNRGSRAVIRKRGAELTSFLVGGDEVIWQSRPDVWSGSAPILFPIIGRLKGGGFTHGGKRYELAKHGLVRSRQLRVTRREAAAVTFALDADAETRACYPFNFCLRVTFTLGERSLRIAYEVRNADDTELHFSLGSHPAIRLPLGSLALEDYYVELSEPETLGRYTIVDGLLSPSPELFLNDAREIPWTPTLFNADALIFKSIRSASVSVKCRRSSRAVRIDTGGAPDLGLWAKPGADYVCVEPWWGYDDPADADGELCRKPGIVSLPARETFQTAITISLDR